MAAEEPTLSPAKAALLARWRNGSLRPTGPAQLIAGAPSALAECSYEQQFLFDRQRETPDLQLYNIGFCARLDAPVDVEVFRLCAQEMSMRHETLRTRIDPTPQNPMQRIGPAPHFDLVIIDLRDRGAGTAERAALDHAQGLLRNPFDLTSGPLVRLGLYRIADNATVLAIVAHHLIADGWSLDIVLSELAALYGATIAGRRAQLPSLPVQYRDFARWQAGWLKRGEWRSDAEFCRNLLADLPPANLPWDREPPAERDFRCAHTHFAFTPAQSTGLRDFSRREGASLFMTMLACLQVLLARTAGIDDVAVGVPMVNRQHQQTQQLIGYFSNYTVVRTNMADSPAFRDVLTRVREGVLQALARQSLPLPLYLEQENRHLDQHGKPNWPNLVREPLYRAQYNFRPPVKSTEFAGATLQPRPLNRAVSTYDFTLLMEDADPLYGKIEYAVDIFDAATVDTLVTAFFAIIDQVVANPDLRIADVAI
ncbi:Linear gramicidin synthase subunit D [Mycobacterium basiliense]|uniref:Linear gramicidin synthase subunit D n=1 Tax=Mycobacterium basiliense TaxID=2094119 RepID=A0A447GDP9_9MYCO|nr:condensation domain-containing protein [Mycobacterium basiliense]VDM88575.1 Linear gramicidin synthase subunit D [Mycobacterium basiliense]